MSSPPALHRRAHDLMNELAGGPPPERAARALDAKAVVSTLDRIRSARARTLPVGGLPTPAPTPPPAAEHKLSRRHVEQAIKLARHALEEDAKSPSSAETMSDFSVDLYCSAIDYLLSAPSNTHDPNLRAKFLSTVRRSQLLVESTAAEAGDAPPAQPAAGAEPAERPAAPADSAVDPSGWVPFPDEVVSKQTRTDFASAACDCGRHVVVPYVTISDVVVYPRSVAEAVVAALVWMTVIVKRSPVPYYASLIMSTVFSALVDFSTHVAIPFGALVFSMVVERTAELDSELQLQRRLAEAVAWGFEVILKVLVASSKAETWTPSKGAAGESTEPKIATSYSFAAPRAVTKERTGPKVVAHEPAASPPSGPKVQSRTSDPTLSDYEASSAVFGLAILTYSLWCLLSA